ncbi:MAG: segregation and condensation protein A [Gammaproteobacteria bacterium]|nr:segregation and condensation protein A [Gammaproteobacteria bacterium]
MSQEPLSKEAQILQVMRKVLTSVAKETFTKPGLRHPLTDETISNMRSCLALISARESELATEEGRSMDMRPRYVDEPRKSVVVPIDQIGIRKKEDDS